MKNKHQNIEDSFFCEIKSLERKIDHYDISFFQEKVWNRFINVFNKCEILIPYVLAFTTVLNGFLISNHNPFKKQETEYYAKSQAIFSNDKCISFVERMNYIEENTKEFNLKYYGPFNKINDKYVRDIFEYEFSLTSLDTYLNIGDFSKENIESLVGKPVSQYQEIKMDDSALETEHFELIYKYTDMDNYIMAKESTEHFTEKGIIFTVLFIVLSLINRIIYEVLTDHLRHTLFNLKEKKIESLELLSAKLELAIANYQSLGGTYESRK